MRYIVAAAIFATEVFQALSGQKKRLPKSLDLQLGRVNSRTRWEKRRTS
jgi:hypothetical protein